MQLDCKTPKPGIEAACLSDVGLQRTDNEDSYLYWEPDSDEDFRRKGRLAIVADGMGGYEGGQEASRLAVETVRHIYDRQPAGDPRASLLAAFQTAHDNILRYAFEHPEFHGMGTTCTALAIVAGNSISPMSATAGFTGSRCAISRLTRDHSYVGRLSRTGSSAPKMPSPIPNVTF